jgi:hypothetical protein
MSTSSVLGRHPSRTAVARELSATDVATGRAPSDLDSRGQVEVLQRDRACGRTLEYGLTRDGEVAVDVQQLAGFQGYPAPLAVHALAGDDDRPRLVAHGHVRADAFTREAPRTVLEHMNGLAFPIAQGEEVGRGGEEQVRLNTGTAPASQLAAAAMPAAQSPSRARAEGAYVACAQDDLGQ